MKQTIKILIGLLLSPIYFIGILCAFIFHTFMNGFDEHKTICDFLIKKEKKNE